MANDIKHSPVFGFYVRGARGTVPVPYLNDTGAPTDPTTPDTEVSKDGGAFADCTEEVTTISGTATGSGYITLTGEEMDASLVVIAAKAASGPKTTLAMITPRVLPMVSSGTATAGSTSSITVADSTQNFVGCIVKTTGGTGGGGTGGANNQARLIVSQSGAACTVSPNWETAPDNTTTYEILLTDMAVNVQTVAGTALTAKTGANLEHFFGNDGAATIAKVDDVLDSGSTICYAPTAASRVVGSDQGGAYSDIGTLDGTTYSTGEDATNGLEVIVTGSLGTTGERLSKSNIRARYAGSHQIGIHAYDYIGNAWSASLATMTNSASLQDFELSLSELVSGNPRYRKADGEVKLRFLHNVTTYNATHRLHIDYICWQQSIVADVPTAAENANAVMAALVEVGVSLKTFARRCLAALAGKAEGGGTATVKFKSPAGTKDRITATVDTDGNRTSVTYDDADE